MSDAQLTADGQVATAPRAMRMPDAFVILFFVVLLAAALTWLIPAGSFETHQVTHIDGSTKTQLIPESFTTLDADGETVYNRIGLFEGGGGLGFFNFAFEGLVSGSKWGSAIGVVAFILVIGGAFGIITKTGAIDNGIMALIKRTQGNERLLIPVMFGLFSLGGAVFGMGEEAIAFCIILVPLVIALGYDSLTAVMITYVATQIGFATSWMNPFSVAMAQGLSDVPVMSGAGFRGLMWAVFTLVGIGWTMRYANRIRQQPSLSLSHASDGFFRNQRAEVKSSFGTGDALVLLTFAAGIIWVIWGVVEHAYYIPEIASQFFTMGIVIGVIGVLFRMNGMTLNDMADGFKQGAQDLLPAAMIVGLAKGIVLLLGGDDPTAPSVLNTILHHAGGSIGQFGETVSALLMFAFQSVFNFFVCSGSGQAALTMPLMAPLADIVGVSRQVAVLAFQLGDGLTNILVPTSASLIGCLGVARVDWGVWAKFIGRFLLVLMGISVLFIVAAIAINFS